MTTLCHFLCCIIILMNQSHQNLVHSFVSVGKAHEQSLRSTVISPSEPQCRICLEYLNTIQEITLTPCKCSGSVAFVHFRCMSEWIARNHATPLAQIAKLDYFTCQMCKFKIVFEVDKKIQCYFRRDRLLFFVLLLFAVGFLALFGFVVWVAAAEKKIGMQDNKWFQSAIIISAIIVILFIQAFSTYILMKRFLLASKARIVKIGAHPIKSRERAQSMCTSQANLVSMERKVRDNRIVPEIIVYDLE